MTPVARNEHEGEYRIAGHSMSRLAAIAGRSPFYAYDRQAITQRISSLKAALPGGVELSYAIKANPHPAVVHHVSSLVTGLDVASHGEMLLAIGSGLVPSQIGYAGPGKRDHELRAALAADVTLHVESKGELQRIASIARELDVEPRVAIRLNPDLTLKRSGMIMGGGPQPFGLDIEKFPGWLELARELEVAVSGVHVFCGSQNLSSDSLVNVQNAVIDSVLSVIRQCSVNIGYLNLGGGFGIPYFPGDEALDIEPVMRNLKHRVECVRHQAPATRIVLELGRYLVGEAGYYVTRVVDRKKSRGRTYLVVDGGLHHHLAASGNLGQVIRRNYPVWAGSCGRGGRETVTVVGSLCTPLDIIADAIELPVLEPGDFIVVGQSGAYGASASPQAFLSHPSPVELLV